MGRLIKQWINPLKYIEAHDTPVPITPDEPDYDSLMRFISTNFEDLINLDKIVANYREISRETGDISISPAQSEFMKKIIFPLKFAKFNFMIENYIGTIALCGMVAEMNAILLFVINHFHINGEEMDDACQNKVFGNKFENLGQYRRIEVLRGYNVLDNETYTHFNNIRSLRKKYLHYYSHDHENIRKDSKEMYNSTIYVTNSLMGIRIVKGNLFLDEKFLEYLD